MGAVECKHAKGSSVSSGAMFPFCLCNPFHMLAHCGIYFHADDRTILFGTGAERNAVMKRRRDEYRAENPEYAAKNPEPPYVSEHGPRRENRAENPEYAASKGVMNTFNNIQN
jgi:hypothetical protein